LIYAINEISNLVKIVYPMHPRTKRIIGENNLKINDNVIIIEPQGYLEFTSLLINSKFVMSDSGTVQEEAVIYNIPCVILRNETEWTEFVEKGKNILATTDPNKIIPIAKELLINPNKISELKSIKINQKKNTCKKIIEIIKNELIK